MRVLYVCTANICRSPSAAALLTDAVSAHPSLAALEVRSAGTAALAGAAGCDVAPALVDRWQAHRSTPLTAELIAGADLVLTAAREHRGVVLAQHPEARSRTFTIRQAGRIAQWMTDSGVVEVARQRAGLEHGAGWAERFAPDDPRGSVAALPDEPVQRWAWLVDELDAGRGVAPAAPVWVPEAEHPVTRRTWWLARRAPSPPPGSGESSEADDVLDPHILGPRLHRATYEQIASATDALVGLMVATAA